MTQSADALQTAMAHQQAGRPQEAATIYRQILAAEPNNEKAMYLLGLTAHQAGDLDEAARLFTDAIRIDGTRGIYHDSLAETYRAQGRLAEAKASSERAIALNPKLHLAHMRLALVHRVEGNLAAAAKHCQDAIALQPEDKIAQHLLAATLAPMGQHDQARSIYDRLLALDPNDLEARLGLAGVFRATRQNDQARQQYERGLAVEPNAARWYILLGNLDASEEKWPSAISHYETAIRLDPKSVVAQMQLATALQAAGRLDEAVAQYRRTIELSDKHVTAHFNLATALESLGRRDEAAAAYRATLDIDPSFTDAHLNLGAHYQHLREFARALDHYDAVLKLDPQSARAHFNRSLVLLTEGNWAAAWPEFQWRLKVGGFPVRTFDEQPWTGDPIGDRTLLLHSEQGLGDTLQFVRYVPVFGQRAARTVLLVQPALVPLLRQSGFENVFADERELPHFDQQASLLSLPAIVGTTLESIPAEIPYLSADPQLVDAWKERLQDVPGFRVGICWQGAARQLSDPHRSAPLEAFEPLARIEGVRLISLQKGDGEEQLGQLAGRFEVHELGHDWDEAAGPFMDTAAVMKHLDLVITVDSAVAHLAGALGVACWVALAAHADWRWLQDRDDSPWYPTMRLFRQAEPGDWGDVFARVGAALAQQVAKR